MNRIHLLLRLLVISTCCLAGIVASKAIVGGYVTEAIQYQATILIPSVPPTCGGGIIGEYFILTAAHCVIAYSGNLIEKPVFVLVGTHDLNIRGMVVEVEKIFVPKEYNPQIIFPVGDIAVLKLKKSLDLERHKLKELHLAKQNAGNFYDNKMALIAGFGWDYVVFENNELNGGHNDSQLRRAEADVRSHIECKQDHPNVNITNKHICARVKQFHHLHRGVCVGDGGGPLVHRGNTVIGILSVIPLGCSEKTTSGIYTQVSFYRDFVRIARENLESPDVRVYDL